MQGKAPCRFKGTCKNFKAGLDCPFSHDKCKFGDKCTFKDTCKFYHEDASRPSQPSGSKFDKPIRQVECRFGATCRKLAEGKCFFKHSSGSSMQAQRPRVDNRAQRPCKFGDQCNQFKKGTCPFKHEPGQSNSMSSGPQFTNQPSNRPAFNNPPPPVYQPPQVSVLDKFCPNFLTNNPCGQGCPKTHNLSITNTINRIFTIEQASQIKKVIAFEPTSPEQQPLYMILNQNRVSFGQLTNLAKEGGHEHIRTNLLVMKRCFSSDIELPGQTILNAWLVTASTQTQKDTLLVLQSNSGLTVIVLNKGQMKKIPINEAAKDIVFIGSVLLVLTHSKTVLGYQYNFSTSDFNPLGQVLGQPLDLVKKYYKSIQGQQFAAGTVNRTVICFINKQLKTYSLDLKQNISDICFTEYGGQPTALALTENGNIIAINLVTFITVNILKTNLPDNYKCSSLNLTLQHLILAIDGFGVIAYNCENLSQIDGILALAPYKWQVECNQNGILTLLSQDHSSQTALNIFKIAKF